MSANRRNSNQDDDSDGECLTATTEMKAREEGVGGGWAATNFGVDTEISIYISLPVLYLLQDVSVGVRVPAL